MLLGIDFGTTRTLVAAVDRGNYPVVGFVDDEGEASEHIPSVVARVGDGLVFGFEAMAAARGGAPVVRSFKRLLAGRVTGDSAVDVDGLRVPLPDLLAGFLGAVRHALVTDSTLADALDADEPLEAVVAVPAHAHSAQRLLTLDAFRAAGFTVKALLNEPSAAGFEYTHRQGRTVNRRRTRVLVYDLGGGTFDASLVRVDDRTHEVLGSLGLNRLGGDDVDAVLAELALAEAGEGVRLDERERAALLDDCRAAKESLTPRTRRIPLQVGDQPVIVTVDAFHEAVRPLVDATLDAMAPLVGGLDASHLEDAEVAGIHLVGGASSLPLVARVLKERFGRRVHRSPYPAASTAIGLAIAADDDAGYVLTERLSRGLGVFREHDAGQSLAFDPLLLPDQRLAAGAPTVVRRRYRPAHNIGVFRFVEYAATGDSGQPTGDVVPAGRLVFPFDSALRDGRDLTDVPVTRGAPGPEVEEEYRIDPSGAIAVRITDLESGHTAALALGAV